MRRYRPLRPVIRLNGSTSEPTRASPPVATAPSEEERPPEQPPDASYGSKR